MSMAYTTHESKTQLGVSYKRAQDDPVDSQGASNSTITARLIHVRSPCRLSTPHTHTHTQCRCRSPINICTQATRTPMFPRFCTFVCNVENLRVAGTWSNHWRQREKYTCTAIRSNNESTINPLRSLSDQNHYRHNHGVNRVHSQANRSTLHTPPSPSRTLAQIAYSCQQ